MKGKYLVILLLIITFICAFCKYSKNVQVRELFIDDKEVKEQFNTGTGTGTGPLSEPNNNTQVQLGTGPRSSTNILQLDDFPDKVSCTNLDDTSNSVMTLLESLYNILDSIITNYQREISKMQESFNTNIPTINEEYRTFSDDNNIQTLIKATVLSPAEKGDNVCDTHIKKIAQNNELVSQINVELEDANWDTLIDDIAIANTSLLTDKEALSGEITKSESFFDKNVISPLIGGISSKTEAGEVIYTAEKTSTSHFGTLLNAIKATNDMINDTKYTTHLNNYKKRFEALKVSLESQKKSNDEKIREIDAVFSADNFYTDKISPLFEGATNDDRSIKRHCNINGLMGGSGICYDNENYQGCFIDCQLTDHKGKCVPSSHIGYKNPAVYTNVFGSSIDIQHIHSHKHPGSHPHDDTIIYIK